MDKKPANDPDSSMSEYKSTQIHIDTQYIKNVTFDSPGAPEIFVHSHQNPQVSVNVDIKAHELEGTRYEVELYLNARAVHHAVAAPGQKPKDEIAFEIDLIYAGVFSVEAGEDAHLSRQLLVECPRLLFPFARRIIADISRDAGFPRLLMQPIDFAEMYERAAAAQKN